jgi:hypothetical protein
MIRAGNMPDIKCPSCWSTIYEGSSGSFAETSKAHKRLSSEHVLAKIMLRIWS